MTDYTLPTAEEIQKEIDRQGWNLVVEKEDPKKVSNPCFIFKSPFWNCGIPQSYAWSNRLSSVSIAFIGFKRIQMALESSLYRNPR